MLSFYLYLDWKQGSALVSPSCFFLAVTEWNMWSEWQSCDNEYITCVYGYDKRIVSRVRDCLRDPSDPVWCDGSYSAYLEGREETKDCNLPTCPRKFMNL